MNAICKGSVRQSGGRPKEIKEVVELARQFTTAAILRLAHWVDSDDPRASVAAAQHCLYVDGVGQCNRMNIPAETAPH